MNAKEKMLAGLPFDTHDADLGREREKATRLLQKFNTLTLFDGAYREILRELLPNTTTECLIRPPFFCDYGYNIYIGEGGIHQLQLRDARRCTDPYREQRTDRTCRTNLHFPPPDRPSGTPRSRNLPTRHHRRRLLDRRRCHYSAGRDDRTEIGHRRRRRGHQRRTRRGRGSGQSGPADHSALLTSGIFFPGIADKFRKITPPETMNPDESGTQACRPVKNKALRQLLFS